MNDIDRDIPPQSRPRTQALIARVRSAPRALIVVAILAVFALAAWLLTPKANAPAAGRFGNGPMPVVIAAATTGDMPITLIGLGTVTPLATVTVQGQIPGQIMSIAFREGQTVRRG